jgi:hypothetical protein
MGVKQAHIVRRAICALVCALAATGTVAQTAPKSKVRDGKPVIVRLPEGRRKAVARKRERRKASVRAKVEQRPGRMSTFDARTRDRRSGAGRTTQPGKEEG